MDLATLGWTPDRERSLPEGLMPGRAVSAARGSIRAQTADGPVSVIVQRGFRRSAPNAADYPAVGDWLALEPTSAGEAALRSVLPRSSAFSRADYVGQRVDEQIVAANVDTVVIVGALNRDHNVRRLERYLALAWASGAEPVVLLNKADLCPDLAERIAEVRAVAGGAPVLASTATTGQGLDALEPYLAPGRTVALLGSSGVGKSTITNALLGEQRQEIREVRDDDARGRHTTTARELFTLPGGGLLIDTPGMRSIGMWDVADGLDRAFGDIEALSTQCRFRDCTHGTEPGCAVQAAIASGELDPGRLSSLRKLDREIQSIERRANVVSDRAESRRLGRMYRDAGKTAERKRIWEAWS
jgi:ribosome biogenesis GTPase